ncbi:MULTISPECIES: hypothetical protein [Xanthomonas]|uniref:Uncharacterized protein n=1 Tax=Xanthomonas phaseoli pv. dieffenbachiae TaxID=92828 RepID=A0A0Q0EGQ2_9XANT|nr:MULTISPECIES: hypothetical protein [Xanthomonas]MBO9748788.1 hypothetical protein [Xanthomonas phaseoli pv. dieffenbachiae]MBO9753568.1 hypothetical protein [Xanthomonas phaseoli pv. dieffenbachiae]MBO9766936.1 hypothetical protein [Xanthomonas phaseoli pv. dieffenbachiae]MBO9777579.1 hypothetical protein [Xanthomonas phaseoli pv. dieffenbachiae]MBO9778502.1 hypothetical protein [Xanthomonas phaseoli pv. dieffenbachiae]
MPYSRADQLLYEEQCGQGTVEYVYLSGSLLATRSNGAATCQYSDTPGNPLAALNAAGWCDWFQVLLERC